MMDDSERGRALAKEISRARKELEMIESHDNHFMSQYAHAVILHAATLSIITNLQYYRGYQNGSKETAKIYRRGK